MQTDASASTIHSLGIVLPGGDCSLRVPLSVAYPPDAQIRSSCDCLSVSQEKHAEIAYLHLQVVNRPPVPSRRILAIRVDVIDVEGKVLGEHRVDVTLLGVAGTASNRLSAGSKVKRVQT